MSLAIDRELIRQRVLRARIRLALQQPFLATALMRLPVREVEDASWCKTAATDGYHIFFNPRWVARLTDSEMRGLLAHEVLHVLFTHADRRRERHPFLWNVACDYAINHLLVQRGFRLPKGGLISEQAQGKTSEQIYAELERRMKRSGGKGSVHEALGLPLPRRAGQSVGAAASGVAKGAVGGAANGTARGAKDSEADGDQVPEVGDDLIDPDDPRVRPVRSADAPDREQAEALRRELRQDAMARLQGDAAGPFKQECDAQEAARIDWRSILRAWLADRIKGDWTNHPFSRRWIHRGLFMPSPGMQVPGHVVFAIDTSGSMSTELLSEIVGELRTFREVFPCRLSVIQCDAALQSIDEYDAMDGYEIPRAFTIKGRGGTDFQPVFRWVEAHAPGAIVLYATDGVGSFPNASGQPPTIWLCTPPHLADAKFPFGVVVRVSASSEVPSPRAP